MSEETATLMLWVFGIVVFLIAIYSVAQAGNEMREPTRRNSNSKGNWTLAP